MTDKSKKKKKTIWKNNRRNQHRKHAARCAWSNAEQKLLHSSYIVSKRVVVLPLVPRNGESELIERDLSGVEGRGAYRPAAEDFRGRRHSCTCPCVLHSSSKPAAGQERWCAARARRHKQLSRRGVRLQAWSFTRARRGGGSTHFHPLRPCRQVPWTTKNTYRNSRAVCDTTPDREQVSNLVKPKVGHHAT